MKYTILVAICCLCATSANAQTTILHVFGLTENDGQKPEAGLTLGGSTLFGTASQGAVPNGVVFKIDTSGSNYSLLHSFSGASDGGDPFAPVLLQNGKLVGTTMLGGSQNQGVLYSLNPDGTGFTLLHTFTGGLNDGGEPQAGVTSGDNKLFGTTAVANNRFVNNTGAIYSINPDGTGFTLLHSFAGGANDGSIPVTAVTLSGNALFGTTFAGGSANDGTLFSLNIDGSGFKLLHTFSGGLTDGIQPDTALMLVGTKLFGMSEKGGSSNTGTLFSINTDGTGFTLLHSFGAAADGRTPSGDLTLVGTKFYGSTSAGGSDGAGTIFSFNADGTGYTSMYSLLRSKDGVQPRGGLVFNSDRLFGTTFQGQLAGAGTVFSLQVPEPSTLVLSALGGLALLICGRQRSSSRDICPTRT